MGTSDVEDVDGPVTPTSDILITTARHIAVRRGWLKTSAGLSDVMAAVALVAFFAFHAGQAVVVVLHPCVPKTRTD